MKLELHAAVRLNGEVGKARELLDRAISTGLIPAVVYELTLKGGRLYVGFSSEMASTSAERASAVGHIAAIAREMGVDSTRVAFDSHHDWLKGLGLREENGEVKGL